MSNAAETMLAEQMGITEAEIRRRLKLVDFSEEDVKAIDGLAEILDKEAEFLAEAFFEHLDKVGEGRGLLESPALLAEARQLKASHLRAMGKGNYGRKYVEERLRLAMIYAQAGISPSVFLGAYQHLIERIGLRALERGAQSDIFLHFLALRKIAFFDLSLMVDTLVFERERVIRLHQEALRELSTPVLLLRAQLLLLPIVGLMDSHRSKQFTEGLLAAVHKHRARVAVIDITGVPMLDTQAAAHLIRTVKAARLMGCTCIVTGISEEVSRALVTLGVRLSEMETLGDLSKGLLKAEALLAQIERADPPSGGPALDAA